MNETLKRILTALIILPLLLYALFLSQYQYLALSVITAIVSALMVLELLSIAEVKGIPTYKWLTVISSVLIILSTYLSAYYPKINTLETSFYITFISTIIIFFLETFKKEFNFSLETVSTHILTLVYCGLAMSFLIKLQRLDPNHLLYIWLITWMTDTGAYFSGKLFGKHKLNLAVSPKKTLEGFIGAIIVPVISAIILQYFTQDYTSAQSILYTYPLFIIVTICLSVLSIFGDLAESILKRSSGVKDSKTYIPGHGGVLDVIDSMVYTVPIYYLLLVLTAG